jgi:hypothetical protein
MGAWFYICTSLAHKIPDAPQLNTLEKGIAEHSPQKAAKICWA